LKKFEVALKALEAGTGVEVFFRSEPFERRPRNWIGKLVKRRSNTSAIELIMTRLFISPTRF
jgi:hypothetical protein